MTTDTTSADPKWTALDSLRRTPASMPDPRKERRQSGLGRAAGWPASRRRDRVYSVAKRALDIAVSSLLLLVLSPLMALIALAIVLTDRGPVLFKQERTGLHGERFMLLKFRTMRPNAEEMKVRLQHLSIVAYPDFKMENDPRVTPVGRLLRASYLDEVPQLLNVLKGEMSLVGPRPTSFAASTYSTWHTERLEVVPGVTGLWQVRRSSEESSFDERVRLDIEYIRNRSLALDLRLLGATFVRQLRLTGR